ncbi:MAG: hypothetical protein DMG81_10785 [Acidobacteria bacterium]|nr:MAG: hypothetical protein DMG81_10785 [Acidobacteriota bacterium]
MFKILRLSCILGMLMVAADPANSAAHLMLQSELNSKDPISIVITFKDGHAGDICDGRGRPS